jgi:hypothetical protein
MDRDELEKIWTEAVIKILPRNFTGTSKKNHERPESKYPMSLLKFEPSTSQRQVQSVTYRSACSVMRILELAGV